MQHNTKIKQDRTAIISPKEEKGWLSRQFQTYGGMAAGMGATVSIVGGTKIALLAAGMTLGGTALIVGGTAATASYALQSYMEKKKRDAARAEGKAYKGSPILAKSITTGLTTATGLTFATIMAGSAAPLLAGISLIAVAAATINHAIDRRHTAKLNNKTVKWFSLDSQTGTEEGKPGLFRKILTAGSVGGLFTLGGLTMADAMNAGDDNSLSDSFSRILDKMSTAAQETWANTVETSTNLIDKTILSSISSSFALEDVDTAPMIERAPDGALSTDRHENSMTSDTPDQVGNSDKAVSSEDVPNCLSYINEDDCPTAANDIKITDASTEQITENIEQEENIVESTTTKNISETLQYVADTWSDGDSSDSTSFDEQTESDPETALETETILVETVEIADPYAPTLEKFSDEYLKEIKWILHDANGAENVTNPDFIKHVEALQDITAAHERGESVNYAEAAAQMKEVAHFLLNDPCDDFKQSYATLGAHMYALSADMGDEQGQIGTAYLKDTRPNLLSDYKMAPALVNNGVVPMTMADLAEYLPDGGVAEAAACFNAANYGDYSLTIRGPNGPLCETPVEIPCADPVQTAPVANQIPDKTVTPPDPITITDPEIVPAQEAITPAPAVLPEPDGKHIGDAHVDIKKGVDNTTYCDSADQPPWDPCINEKDRYQVPQTAAYQTQVGNKNDYIGVTVELPDGGTCDYTVNNMIPGSSTQLHTEISGIFSQLGAHLTQPENPSQCLPYILGLGKAPAAAMN